MRIKFTGYMDIPKGQEPDDRGSIDIWLANHLQEELNGFFGADGTPIGINWEIDQDGVPSQHSMS